MIDSVKQKVYLPEDKLHKLDKELNFWCKKKTATLKQMQILCGTLNYCCKVIRGGRIYMHHMIELLKLFNHTDRITLPLSFHDDLSWWITYSNLFNGTADFLNPLNSTEEIFTDACLDGVGGIYKNDYYQGLIIPSGDKTLSITPIGHHNYTIFSCRSNNAKISMC